MQACRNAATLLNGIGEAAEADLQADARRLQSKVWPREAVDLHLGAHTPETLLAALTAPDERAEAHFYVGQWHLMKGDRTEAVKALRKAMQGSVRRFSSSIRARSQSSGGWAASSELGVCSPPSSG